MPSEEGNQKVSVGLESNPLEAEIDFCTWALCIPRWVLWTRTEFSWKQCFSVRWCESVAAPTTTFPSPVSRPGCFAGGGPGLPRRQLLKVAKRRLLHVIIYVLNYLFLGRFPVTEEIQRRPNNWQLACFSGLYAVLDVCGNERASYPMVPGRSDLELGAELFLLEKFVESRCGPLQPYHDGFPKKFTRDRSHIDLEKFPELMPYKPLDASGLRLVGFGKWRMEDHLHGPFWLLFVEPRFLLHGDECDPAEIPRFGREDRAENLRLAKLWEAHGLLRIFRGPLVEGHFSRVFNCHKNRECDRQIGNRRLPNGRGNHIHGPSKFLSTGHLFCNLRVCPYLERLRCSVTDRRDFYHQCGVSEYRAHNNMLPSQFSEDEVGGFSSKLVARMAGNWVSSLLLRRPFSFIVEGFFASAADAEKRPEDSLVPFGAGVRQEVAMLAVMAPLMATDAAVTYQRNLFATDASLGLGAIVKTRIDEELSEVLWFGSDQKGTYSKFVQPVKSLLCAVGEEEYENVAEIAQEVPLKAPPLYFVFVEIHGRAGIVSRCASGIGLFVAPPFDLDASVFYVFASLRLLEWCLHMVEGVHFRSFLAEPPCTIFAAAAHPACRSYKELLGFPRRSKPAWTSHWRMLLEEGFGECILASCPFGFIHKKEFVFLFFLLNAEAMQKKCPGGHANVKIEGRFTRPSADYVRGLTMHVAKGFRDALVFSDLEQVSTAQGFESVGVNDASICCRWGEERSWFWEKKAHINELGFPAATSLVAQQAREHPGSRFCNIVGSRDSLGALSIGRSSSRCLNRSCGRVAALVGAGDLYPDWLFGSTRLNVAGDPTRLVSIRTPSTFSIRSLLAWHQFYHLHDCHLPRCLSGWVQLFLLIGFLPVAEGFSPSSFCFDCWTPQWSVFRIDCWTPQWSGTCSDCWIPQWISSCFDCWAPQWNNLCFGCWTPQWINLYFDCWTPQWILLSEAVFPLTFRLFPVFSSWSLAIFRCLDYLLLWISSSLIWCSLLLMLGFSLSLAGSGVRCTIGKIPLVILTVAAAPLQPCSHVEQQRAATRSLTDLVASRVVRPETRASRDALLQEFQVWLYEDQGISLSVLLTAKPPDAEEICRLLVEYGKQMFAAGRAYGKYAETINAIGAARPFVKKHLTQAWDLAFAWLADEPGQHHPALPLSVLLSITSVALMWGWVFEAGAICLAWCGILRIGEVFLAQRRDLILPSDSMPGIHFILLKIKLPKTRGRSAKHQAARVDPIDIVELLTAIYADLPSDAPLWPFSASTLRKRFNSLLEALNLDTKKTVDGRPFGLGSLRAGGATHLLLETENPDLVRRRGRWLAHRTMEVYLQEVMVTTFASKLSPLTRDRIYMLAQVFPKVARKAIHFLQCAIPSPSWYRLFQAGDT